MQEVNIPSSDISSEVMAELKACEKDMLSCFMSICDKLGLSYFLSSGTLLGAVRHQGFIPWDDDIDVGMLRSDYEIFMREAPKMLPDYYFLQTYETDPSYPHNFAKIRDSRTSFIETLLKDLPINHGAFIDIFPYDYYPESKLAVKFFKFRKKFLKARIDEVFYYDHEIKRSFLGRVMLKLGYMMYPDVKAAVAARERLYRSVKKSSKVAFMSSFWGDKEIIDVNVLKDTSEVTFEDLKPLGPTNYDNYLTCVYGDYMTPPPPEKRVTHHDTEVIDLMRSYKEYLNG